LEENEKKIANLENRLVDLKLSLTEEQKALAQEQKQNRELRQDIFTLQEKLCLDSEENTKLARQIENLNEENQKFRKRLFQREIQNQEKELERLANNVKRKLNGEEKEELDSLIEAQNEFITTENNYAQKQLERSQRKLLKNRQVSEREIENILQLQVEIIGLQKEAETRIESLIEITPR
jgi:hypothetical protein